jgi:hypothetical protein
MTEAEWLASDNPRPMLDWLRARASDRKFRLFGCACCRGVWPLLTNESSRRAVEMAERYADGEVAVEQLIAAAAAAWDAAWASGQAAAWAAARAACPTAARDAGWAAGRAAAQAAAWATARAAGRDAGQAAGRAAARAAAWAARRNAAQAARRNAAWAAARAAAWDAGRAAAWAKQGALLRDLAGNPWRPVRLPALSCPNGTRVAPCHLWQDGRCLACGFPGPGVLALARAAYDQRLPDGLLDPDRLAVLADALEDDGCDNEELLRHLRGFEVCAGSAGWQRRPGPHGPGCWAVDLLLGKS